MLSLPKLPRRNAFISALVLASLSSLTVACTDDDDPGAEEEVGTEEAGEEEAEEEGEEEGEEAGEESVPACEDTAFVLAGPEAASPEGYAGGLLIERFAHPYMATVAYMPQDGELKVDIQPPAEEAQMALAVEYAEGELRYIVSEPNEAAIEAGAELDCRERLEADVELYVVTDDDLLQEKFDAVIFAEIDPGDESLGDGMIVQPIDLDALTGGLAIASVEPADPDLFEAELVLRFSYDEEAQLPAMSGKLGGRAEYHPEEGDDAEASFMDFLLAIW